MFGLKFLAVMRRDLKKLMRNPVTLLSVILMPILYLVIIGNSFQGQLKHLPIVVVEQDHGLYARRIVEQLLAKDAKVSARGARGQTALMWAVAQKHPEVVKGVKSLAALKTVTALFAHQNATRGQVRAADPDEHETFATQLNPAPTNVNPILRTRIRRQRT